MPQYTQQKIYDHPADVYPRNVWRSLEALVEISSEISEEDIPIFRSYSHRRNWAWTRFESGDENFISREWNGDGVERYEGERE